MTRDRPEERFLWSIFHAAGVAIQPPGAKEPRSRRRLPAITIADRRGDSPVLLGGFLPAVQRINTLPLDKTGEMRYKYKLKVNVYSNTMTRTGE